MKETPISFEALRLLKTATNGKRPIRHRGPDVVCAAIPYSSIALDELVQRKFAVRNTGDAPTVYKTTKRGREFADKQES